MINILRESARCQSFVIVSYVITMMLRKVHSFHVMLIQCNISVRNHNTIFGESASCNHSFV